LNLTVAPASISTEVAIVGVVNAGLVLNTILVLLVPVVPAADVIRFRVVAVVVTATFSFSLGEVRVLLVKVSVPARVARVPVVGKVTPVAPVEVNVVVYAPTVAKVAPSAMVIVADVAGAVIATLLIEVAVATPSAGVVNVGLVRVLFVRVSVPANVLSVLVTAGNVTVTSLAAAPAVNVVASPPCSNVMDWPSSANVPVTLIVSS
jgi:hypothetical protein